MTVRLHFSSAAVGSCRFAVSPLRETMSAIRLIARGTTSGFHEPWLREIAPALDQLDLTPLALLAPRRTYGPDFLCPQPVGPTATFEDELQVVRSIKATQVRREVDRCLSERFGGHPPPAADSLRRGGATARDLCADALLACWTSIVLPWWPRIRQVLDADIAYRARLLADSGVAGMFADLHPRVRWSRRTLQIDLGSDAERGVGTEGLVLVPGVFGWPGVGLTYERPWPATLDYSARGIAALWSASSPSPTALVHLVGARRAALLTALDEPASTTGLATRCAIAVSSVSEQLAVLRAANLVATWRTGRSLQHTRTPLGTALVEAPSTQSVQA